MSLALVLSLLAARPFTANDLVMIERVTDAQISPDGKWVAFNVRTTDLDTNKDRTDLWLVCVDGEGLKRLTSHEANNYNARWMPDGRSLVFLSTRSGSAQV